MKKMQNKGYYAVQGHSSSLRTVSIKSPNETSYLVTFRSYRSLLFRFWALCISEPPLRGLETMYDVHLRLIGERVVDFLLMLTELFRYRLRLKHYRRKQIENWRFASSTKFSHGRGRPRPIIFAGICRPTNALQHSR